MKKYFVIFFVLVILAQAFAQPGYGQQQTIQKQAGQTDLLPGTERGPNDFPQSPVLFSHYENFYRKNVKANFLISSQYSGFSAALLQLKRERLALGLSFQVNQVSGTNDRVRELYGAGQTDGQYFFVPFLFNIKIPLLPEANVSDFEPYLIAGLGPAFGLYMPYGNFFKNFSTISGKIGGGGFAGAGVDYFWQEEWAFSLDIRYNLYAFTHPLGRDQDYRGLSVFLGFSRALDY